MNLHALLHLPDSNYAYGYNQETIHIRLRSAKSDVKNVTLRFGDPYQWHLGGGGGNLNAEGAKGWTYEEVNMRKEGSTELFDYWIASMKPPFRRSRYGFIVEGQGQKVFYGEGGIFDYAEVTIDSVLTSINNYFCFPFLNAADVFDAPSWAKHTVWYQIFPERFANGDETLNKAGTLPWGSTDPTASCFFGGDIKGMSEKLDYLADLGINGIYLCPIFKAPTNHKYDTEDYFEIDPQFGDKATFKTFVDLAHSKGIKIMMDMVVNHCGYQFGPWQDVLKNQEKSKYKDWFHIKHFPVVTLEEDGLPNYDTFAFVKTMPKTRTEHPEVREYFLNVARYWTREFNIDGWRLDVANEVDHVFWREFRKAVREIKEDVYILGEIWHDANPWLKGDQFDAVMNYPLTGAIHDFIAKEKTTPTEFKAALSNIHFMYPRHVSKVNFNLLGSHDTERVLTLCKNSKAKALLSYGLLMTLPGAPCIYYGDEVGMDGGHDPLCRKCMIWDEDKQDQHMLQFFKKIIELRKTHSALRTLDIDWVHLCDESGYVVFKKSCGASDIYVMLNNSKHKKPIDLSILPEGPYVDLLTDKTLIENEAFVLKPYEMLWLSSTK